MTEYMKALVEEHLPCVKEVISKRIFALPDPLLSYEDLYQVGCEALCNAAIRYDPERGPFKAYACTAIYNAIVTYCKAAGKLNLKMIDIDLTIDNDNFAMFTECEHAQSAFEEVEDAYLYDAFQSCRVRYSGVARRGVEAIELKMLGFTTPEIAAMYKTNVKNVNAWISRAKSKLKTEAAFRDYFS